MNANGNDNLSIPKIADHVLNWARQSEEILALYRFGSYAVSRVTPGSDLDAAILLKPDADIWRINRRHYFRARHENQEKNRIDQAEATADAPAHRPTNRASGFGSLLL